MSNEPATNMVDTSMVDTSMRESVAHKLRVARERAGLTLAGVHERTGIGESSLSDFENGKRSPSLSQLAELAQCYRRSISFFFEEGQLSPPEVVLWRERPAGAEAQDLEARFLRLAEQYHNLEVWCGKKTPVELPRHSAHGINLDFRDAEELAKAVARELNLGDRPAFALLGALEEDCGVKVFHMDFEPSGSAACTSHPERGAAILLNAKNPRRRRNFDLAHELFHLLTWDLFRPSLRSSSTEEEEKLANAFASHLLLPGDALTTAVNSRLNGNKMPLDSFFEIARDFDVSPEALVWRLHRLYGWDMEKTRKNLHLANDRARLYTQRIREEEPPTRPARFHALAVTALRKGEIALGRFAEYLGISRNEAKKYLEQDSDHDEEIELPPA